MNKKNIVIYISIIFLIITFGFAKMELNKDKESFEGTIKYLISVESKTKNIKTEELQNIFGDTMVFKIQNDNYRLSYNGSDIKDVYYIGKKNMEYALRKNIDTLFISFCDKEDRKMISSKLSAKNEYILNRNCKMLLNDVGETKNYYWFDPKLYINPKNFKNHKFNFINFYYEKAKSPWLKYKYEGKSFNITYTAIEIKEEKIEEKTFELPKLPEANLE
jgi:hypothetical protein